MRYLFLSVLLFLSCVATSQQAIKFTLSPLGYSADALSPVISEKTINYHYGKHLQAYINNLNTLLPASGLESLSLEEIVKRSDGALFNNAAQTYNHQFYFDTFSPTPKMAPEGALLDAINKKWGSLDNFKAAFEAAGVSIFGSGWVWLAADANADLSIIKCLNADNPLTHSLIPLLGADVWEHAYYLDYQNRRADHLKSLWQITDWQKPEERLSAIKK